MQRDSRIAIVVVEGVCLLLLAFLVLALTKGFNFVLMIAALVVLALMFRQGARWTALSRSHRRDGADTSWGGDDPEHAEDTSRDGEGW